VEHGGPDGPLTGGREAERQPSDGERWQWPNAHGGEGGCGGVRQGRGALL
jgi:hypothetical protein